jgi:pyruvate/2-oxoglutarate dehydrogenase complex dihydrolipoamide dehydrogenase (E3) component
VRRHAELLLGRTLTAVEPVGDALRVHLGDESVETDLVVLALGVSPATELLAGSGAATVRPGALLVDDRMRTSLPGVVLRARFGVDVGGCTPPATASRCGTS